MTVPRPLVATPVGGGVVAHDYVHGINALRQHLVDLDWSVEFVSQPDGLVTRSRNSFASYVVRNERFTHLLMLDADVVVPPAGIERLVLSGHDVAGCVVPLRNVNWTRVREHLDQRPAATVEELRAIASEYAVTFDRGQKAVDGFIPVRHIGSAAMLISRAALVTMSESNTVTYARNGLHAPDQHHEGWTFFDPLVDDDGNYLSEDYAFCDRWQALGGQVWADLRTPTRHIGPVGIAGDIATSIAASSDVIRALREREASSSGGAE
jgi:hypothetical protein